jgi:hypothetical protein
LAGGPFALPKSSLRQPSRQGLRLHAELRSLCAPKRQLALRPRIATTG